MIEINKVIAQKYVCLFSAQFSNIIVVVVLVNVAVVCLQNSNSNNTNQNTHITQLHISRVGNV